MVHQLKYIDLKNNRRSKYPPSICITLTPLYTHYLKHTLWLITYKRSLFWSTFDRKKLPPHINTSCQMCILFTGLHTYLSTIVTTLQSFTRLHKHVAVRWLHITVIKVKHMQTIQVFLIISTSESYT